MHGGGGDDGSGEFRARLRRHLATSSTANWITLKQKNNWIDFAHSANGFGCFRLFDIFVFSFVSAVPSLLSTLLTSTTKAIYFIIFQFISQRRHRRFHHVARFTEIKLQNTPVSSIKHKTSLIMAVAVRATRVMWAIRWHSTNWNTSSTATVTKQTENRIRTIARFISSSRSVSRPFLWQPERW